MLYCPPGFESGDQRPSSGGAPILFPFPGRIERARFEYAGESYELPPGDAFGNAIHGFVFSMPWRVLDQSDEHVTAEFQGSVDAPQTLASWPSDYRIRATYRLTESSLELSAECSNPGTEVLPYGLATHAYFRLPLVGGGDPEETVLTVPVDAQWTLADMIPTGELRPTSACAGFTRGLTLAGQQFDSAFRLDAAAEGAVTSSIAADGVRLSQTCDNRFRCYVVYTPGHREAVCVEPYTCVPSPFGVAERGVQDTGLQVLKPGESHDYKIELAVQRA